MSKIRECICCSKSYRYCPSCGEYVNYPIWMAEFDSDVCHEIFNVVSGYNMGVMTKSDVKKVIDKFKIKDFSIFKDSIANKLNELFSKEEIKTESNTITTEETSIEENVIEEVVKDEQSQSSYNYKRNNKKKYKNVDMDLSENE